MSYRKVEHVEFPLLGQNHWKEISFSELKKGDIFRMTDLDDNGKISLAGEEGKIRIAASDPYNNNGVLTIEAEDYEFTEDEIFAS